MVTNDLFSDVWRNVLRYYVRGIRLVEALMHRYGFGRLRLTRRRPEAPDLGHAFGMELAARELAMRRHYVLY